MSKATNLTEALNEFKARYPNVTSADLQTFILGFNAAMEIYCDSVGGNTWQNNDCFTPPKIA